LGVSRPERQTVEARAAAAVVVGKDGNLSQLSHGLTGRYETTASVLDTRQDAYLRIRIPAHWPDTFH
jgi:hypothetical protein